MICPNCNSIIDNDSRFCRFCGSRIIHRPTTPVDVVSEPKGFESGFGYVDLGLPSGLLWATCNIGATKPEEFGDYFVWGDIVGRKNSPCQIVNDSGKDTIENYKRTGLIDQFGKLSLSHDAAYQNWGGNWRVPTNEDFEELEMHCRYSIIEHNGVSGNLVKGKNGNCIFLPFCGPSHRGFVVEAHGCYWSSSLLSSTSNPLYFYIDNDSWCSNGAHFHCYWGHRGNGYCIRPVLKR